MIPYFYFRAFINESSDLTCRTEKDKHGRLNFRTAGRREYNNYSILLHAMT